MNPRYVLAGLFLFLVSGTAAATDRFEAVRMYIRAGLIEQSAPSIAVAVAKDGVVMWEEGFGWADREKRIPANEHTMYSLASISKSITSTGLMTLVQAGKVELDKPANDYLGYAKLRARAGDAQAATVRRLANHTSGLPVHYQFFYSDEPYRAPSMEETILRYGQLVTPPAERFQYANLGSGLLGYIIERVSGVGYAEFMRREVFLPLGLTHTSIGIGPGLESYAATRYGKDGLPIPYYTLDTPAAGEVLASAHDLVRFGLFHLKAHLRDQKPILSDASINEMHRRTAELDDDSGYPAGYGIGFVVREMNGYHLVAHSGGMGGVSTRMRLFPNEKLAVVVLSNADTPLTQAVTDRITAALLPKWEAYKPHAQPPPATFAVPDSLRGTWKGTLSTYSQELPVELIFLPTHEVHAKLGDQLFALVNDPQLEDGVFTGELAARIGTPDTERYDYVVSLRLKLRGAVLNGSASASDVPGPRVRNTLTHWVELRREAQ